jgi:hypothetical protein
MRGGTATDGLDLNYQTSGTQGLKIQRDEKMDMAEFKFFYRMLNE